MPQGFLGFPFGLFVGISGGTLKVGVLRDKWRGYYRKITEEEARRIVACKEEKIHRSARFIRDHLNLSEFIGERGGGKIGISQTRVEFNFGITKTHFLDFYLCFNYY